MMKRLAFGLTVVFLTAAAAIPAAAESDEKSIALFNEGLVADQKGDYARAVELFRESAGMGYPHAQIFLGLMFVKGDGIPKDEAEGAKWLRRGADHGDNVAQFYLGLQYIKGKGVPQDDVTAHMWLNLAASHGRETPWRSQSSSAAFQASAATQRDALAEKMTSSEVAAAQKMAAEWKPTH